MEGRRTSLCLAGTAPCFSQEASPACIRPWSWRRSSPAPGAAGAAQAKNKSMVHAPSSAGTQRAAAASALPPRRADGGKLASAPKSQAALRRLPLAERPGTHEARSWHWWAAPSATYLFGAAFFSRTAQHVTVCISNLTETFFSSCQKGGGKNSKPQGSSGI